MLSDLSELLPTLPAFVLASLLLGLTPGPDNIFVLVQSATHGRRAGILVTLGLCTGLLVHTAAVALGVAALLQSSAIAFTFLKTIGAGYLLWLAWQAFRSSSTAIKESTDPTLQLRGTKLYVRGIVMNVTNPKVSLFFLAYLPQFVSASSSSIAVSLIVLGIIFIITTLVTFSTIAYLAGSLGSWLRATPRAQTWLNRTAGVVFTCLAIGILASDHT